MKAWAEFKKILIKKNKKNNNWVFNASSIISQSNRKFNKVVVCITSDPDWKRKKFRKKGWSSETKPLLQECLPSSHKTSRDN